jgi:flagellar protein FlgJ
MELESIGNAYFENYWLGANGFFNRSENSAASVQDFADTLKRMTPSAEPESASIPGKSKVDKTDKLYEQCLELETFLIKNMLSGMRKTVQKSGLVDEGFAGKMYEDMLYDEYAKQMAHTANFGFAEMVYLELTGQRGN